MEKDTFFVANTRDVLRSFPAEVRRQIGYEIMRLQHGLKPKHYRPMAKTIGTGVAEIRVKFHGEYRLIYTAALGDAVYIISAFKKKTRKTPKTEINLAKARLAELKETLKKR